MGIIELIAGVAMLFAVLIVPGYFLSMAFFPKKEEVNFPERIVFSFAFSVAFMPLLMLLLNQVAGVPINYFSSIGVVIALILVGFAGFFYRTRTLSVLPV